MYFLEERYPEAVDILDNAKEDNLAVYDFPTHYRKKMRTTNMTERTNEEIQKRERVIQVIPKDASAMMLARAYLQELSEEWTSGRRTWTWYMDMTEFHEAKAKTGTKGNGLSETTSKHGSTRGRGGEYVTVSEFTAVLGVDWKGYVNGQGKCHPSFAAVVTG